MEPDVAGAPVPAFLEQARDRAQSLLRGTVEITERALTAAPAELIALVTCTAAGDGGSRSTTSARIRDRSG